ncbi:adhesion G protein-coupled receptor L4 isoform X1 [Arapaima gigas]
MECLLKSPMKLVLLAAWLSILLGPGKFSDICKKCHSDATCENKNGSFECRCKHGFTGDGIKFCTDDDECQNVTDICGKNANCTNKKGSYSCACKPGFKSTGQESFQTNDGTRCEDIDECKNETVCGPLLRCHNTNGSYDCVCQPGYDQVSDSKNKTDCRGKHIIFMHSGYLRKQTSGELSPVDVISSVEALSHSVSLMNPMDDTSTDMQALVNETITEFVSTVNSLVKKDELTAWFKIKKDDRERTVTKLLHTVEEATLSISQNYKTTKMMEVNRDHIALKLYSFDSQQSKKINVQTTMEEDTIKLTSKRTDINGNVSVVFLHYNGINNLLKYNNDRPIMDSKQFAELKDFTVKSQVIAVALKPANIYEVEHITFSLKHLEPIDPQVDITKCAFWEYSLETMKGQWATRGCERSHVNTSHTTCICNHLTHFAILMSSGRADLSAHADILTRITQLGMIISIICLSMCIFTFWFFSEIQSTRTTIHKNLCCSLFMGEFIFLVGIKMSAHKLFCSIVAMLLHYFFLAAFAWMCIEGIHLYLIVVGVIYNKGFLHRNFYIFGYGSPAVVVLISASLGYKYYGTSKACWLSTENNFIWSFIGPACLIILVNLLAFGVIIYKVYRHTALKKPEISHYENVRSCARGALALLFVLGATWTFGVLHILHETTATAYLFTIFNVFQGMFIFIFLCVLSRKIQEEYYRLFKNVPCCFEFLR